MLNKESCGYSSDTNSISFVFQGANKGSGSSINRINMRSAHLSLLLNAILEGGNVLAAFVSQSPSPFTLPLLSTTHATTQQPVDYKIQRDSTMYQSVKPDDSPMPPHTALAQVLANQYNIDLGSVQPLGKERWAKITAADVEFHAYKLSQPPSTPQALALAYSYGLDLNVLYEEWADEESPDDGKVNYLTISDVQLLKDNLRSLRASRQKVQSQGDLPAGVKRKQKHLKALDERMEQNVVQLSEKAMQAIGSVAGILQTFQSQVASPLAGAMFGMRDDKLFNSIEDVDEELAEEIQAALSSAGMCDEETANVLNLLDMSFNETKANGVNGSSKNGIESIKQESKEPSLFFADPK